ncbi:MAG TPA: DUF2934 domain-containing protein [Candidatus Binataceae bacterium]|nr:DUF2934 domain-containing protein [Candidatus Binataceae bacterium]
MAAPRKPGTAGVRKKKTATAPNHGTAATAGAVASPPSPAEAATEPAAAPPAAHGANGVAFAAIQLRAYEIYRQRGVGHGDELSDWLAAEFELREKSAQSG